MRISTVTSGSISAGVWSAATRTLTADPATDAGAAALVWARATRNLTGLGTALTLGSIADTSIANGVSVDLRPAANTKRDITAAVQDATAGIAIQLYDGTQPRAVFTGLAATPGGFAMVGTTSAVGMRLANSTGTSGNYQYTYADVKI